MITSSARSASRNRLTPDDAVLLLIDHQVGPLWELEFAELRRRVAALAAAARSLGVPTILTAIAAEDQGPIIPELTAASPDATLIERTVTNPWDEPRVRRAVESTGRTQLIIAGVSAGACVVFPALAAADAGYDVRVVLDACDSLAQSGAVVSVLRMARAGVMVSNAAPLLTELTSGTTDPRVRALHVALDAPPARTDAGARPGRFCGRRWGRPG